LIILLIYNILAGIPIKNYKINKLFGFKLTYCCLIKFDIIKQKKENHEYLLKHQAGIEGE